MLKESGYPVLAPSKVKAEGGKFRMLKGLSVRPFYSAYFHSLFGR